MKKCDEEIAVFCESILDAVGNMDLTTIEPVNYSVFHPLFAEEWVSRMELVLKKMKEKKLTIKQLAEKITGPSHLRAQSYFLFFDLKSAKTPKEKRMQLADLFNELLKEKAKADAYGLKSNIKHTEEEIRSLLKRPIFRKGTEQKARLLGKLYSAAYHLTNGLYTDFYTDYGVENFGPYYLKNGDILVIKQFNDLNPAIWQINTPCKKLTIYCIYRNVKYRSDAISVHSIYEGDPIKNLVMYAVEVDGRLVNSEEELKQILEQIEILSIQQWQNLLALKHEELKIKCLEMRCYVFKDFFEFLGISWEPDKKMLNAVKDKPFAMNHWKPPEEKDKEREYWRKMLNPLIEFYPC